MKKTISIFLSVIFFFSLGTFSKPVSAQNNESEEISFEIEAFLERNSQYETSISLPDDSDNYSEINTNRLIVITYSDNFSPDNYNAVDRIRVFHNWFVLQYNSPQSAENAFKKFENDENIKIVEYDKKISIEDVFEGSQTEENDWYTSVVESNKAMEILSNYNSEKMR